MKKVQKNIDGNKISITIIKSNKVEKLQGNIEGNYYSTYAFVHQNNLDKIANKVLGKGWEAEDDVNQIQQIINALGIGKFSVNCNERLRCDEEDIEVRKISDLKNKDIDKAFKQLISLYDICDDLENDGEDKKSEKMRFTLNRLGIFIQSLKN